MNDVDRVNERDATIAALQARAEQAERLVASQAQEIIQRRQTLGDLAHLHQEQSKQLTQRTAELEAAKAIQAIDLKNNNAYREQVANLQAELERVKGERDEAISKVDKWRDKWLERGAELAKPCCQCGHSSFDPTQRVVQSQHRQGMEG